MCPKHQRAVACHIVIYIIVSIVFHQAECRTPHKPGTQLLASLINKALGLGRMSKWNEFMEEQPSRTSTKLSLKTPAESNATASSSKTQSLIDETKDPNSPFYISMISSNIGASHPASTLLNTRNTINNNNNNTTNSQSNANASPASSSTNSTPPTPTSNLGSFNKLFTYAFPSTHPPRGQMKRPLITYINVSNLEEHEQVEPLLKLGSLTETNGSGTSGQHLSLLNAADPNASGIQMKRRLPECATQQVCSAHYVRSNHTQKLCECSSDFNWKCEESAHNEDHVIDLTRKQETLHKEKRSSLEVYTQVKLCENLKSLKPCKTPTDWTIMALQSERTGKAHYVVVCKCPDPTSFEGPFTHKHPPYARFPGIRVYGMLCNQGQRKAKDPKALEIDQNGDYPEFPWELAYAVINSTTLQGFW